MPLKIVHSDIGKLEVKIPWMKRMKEPTEIYLEDLTVLIEATDSIKDFDIVEERMRFLDKLMEQCVLKLKEVNNKAEQDNSSFAYYKRLILDNLFVNLFISLIFRSKSETSTFVSRMLVGVLL
jgi:hypothetical protein